MRGMIPKAALRAMEVHRHKLCAPLAYRGAIQREAILDQVFADECFRVVLFQGPAGHGKSTLLQQAKSLSEAAGALTSWLTFDEADNDLQRFFLHFEALLESLRSDGDRVVAPLGDDVGSAGLRWRIDWFMDLLTRSGRHVSLFFDEFQVLSDPSILSFFRGLLARIPETVRVFIGSRSVPEIGLARLVVNRQALVFRADELRFSAPEASRFFALSKELAIRDDEVVAIFKQTEGWPAALQLFRLTLVNPSVRTALGNLGSFRLPELAEYLADNVLSLQTPEIQEFLLRTSLLTRLCAPLCDAVTGHPGSQEILLFLERSGLFVRRLDAELHWFRFHTLFSSFLEGQLRLLSRDTILEVHRRASDWYWTEGLFGEAIHHAIAANERGLAADILTAWSSSLVAGAHLKIVEQWYEHLPLDEVERRPDLVVRVAWALIFLRRRSKLQPILTMLERQVESGKLPDDDDHQIVLAIAALLDDDLVLSNEHIRSVQVFGVEPCGFQAFHLGAAANLRGFLALIAGDFEATYEYAVMGRMHSDRAEASFPWGYSFSLTGLALLMHGRLGEAIERLRSALAEPKVFVDDSFAAVSLAATYSYALYEANDLAAAESQLCGFKELIAQATMVDWVAVAYVTMARIHDIRNRPEQADAVLDEAECIGLANAWPRLVRIVNWEKVRRLLLRGAVGEARSKASRIGYAEGAANLPPGWIPFSEETEGDTIGRVRLAIHLGQPEEALKLLAGELTIAQQTHRIRRQVKLVTLAAMAHARIGNENLARRNFHDALTMARRCGYVRTILDEGDAIVGLLRDEYESIGEPANGADPASAGLRDYIATLLDASGAGVQKARATRQFAPLEPLTQREIEILAFLANGVSNKEMAKRVFVSENTIKFHLKNIYGKLGVSSRLQAILAGRQIGVI